MIVIAITLPARDNVGDDDFFSLRKNLYDKRNKTKADLKSMLKILLKKIRLLAFCEKGALIQSDRSTTYFSYTRVHAKQ